MSRERRVGDRVGGWRGAEAGPVVAAIDPDGGQPEPFRRNVVVEQALGDVQDPFAWQTDPLEGDLEVARVRLVAAGLLGRDDPLESIPRRAAERANRSSSQLVMMPRPKRVASCRSASLESGKAGQSPTESANAATSVSSGASP